MNRRTILKGFSLGTSAALLAPLVRGLEAHAAGDAAKPRRFVFVVEGNGVTPEQVQPVGLRRRQGGRNRDVPEGLRDLPLKGLKLPPALEPLEPFRDRLTILQGLSGKVCGGGHSNNYGALGVFPGRKGAFAETIDVALARAVPSVFSHVALGMTDRADHTIVYNVSAFGPGKPAPTLVSPTLAYNTLFGSVAGGTGAREFVARTNLLDFMADDVKRLEGRLAGPEREKVQSYLAAYESMRDRQSKLNDIQGSLRKHAPAATDKYRSGVETDKLDAMFDMGAAALIGGLTNVLVVASGCGDPYFSVRFKGLGIDLDKHSIGHGGSFGGKTWYELSETIRRYHIDRMAGLAKKLHAVKEGDGTMLDNTVIVYMSDSAESHHSRCQEWPYVVLGGMGGKMKTARYVEYPAYGAKGHRTINGLYSTLLHLAGRPRDAFGVYDPTIKDTEQKGPLRELLA